MTVEFVRIDASNIDHLSALFESYSGSPLHKVGILRSAHTLPAWSVYEADQATGFYYTLRFAPDVLKLTNIFVSNTARRQGLGSAMLTHLFEVMPADFTSVIAANSTLFRTRENKVDPESFYLRNGFSVLSKTPNTKIFWKSRA